MTGTRAQLFRAGLELLHLTRVHRLLESAWGGVGLVFTLHHVKPRRSDTKPAFHPNGILEITPDFLGSVLGHLRSNGIELISLAQAINRLISGDPPRGRFACFTIDDGYRDNFTNALPVFRRHDCPFTVFITPGIIDGTTELWWLALEEVIASNDKVVVAVSGGDREFVTEDPAAKYRAFNAIYWPLRSMAEEDQRAFIRELCAKYEIDWAAICRREAMNWHEVRRMASEPLVTIGAHSVNHYALAKLGHDDAFHELCASRDRIAEETGTVAEFFCYPYGDPASAGPREFELAARAGYRASFTTRKGVLFLEHVHHLHGLPRVSLNGEFQALRYVDLYLSGAPFALWNRFERINVA